MIEVCGFKDSTGAFHDALVDALKGDLKDILYKASKGHCKGCCTTICTCTLYPTYAGETITNIVNNIDLDSFVEAYKKLKDAEQKSISTGNSN